MEIKGLEDFEQHQDTLDFYVKPIQISVTTILSIAIEYATWQHYNQSYYF